MTLFWWRTGRVYFFYAGFGAQQEKSRATRVVGAKPLLVILLSHTKFIYLPYICIGLRTQEEEIIKAIVVVVNREGEGKEKYEYCVARYGCRDLEFRP